MIILVFDECFTKYIKALVKDERHLGKIMNSIESMLDPNTYKRLLDDALYQLESKGFLNDETSKFGNIIQHQGDELIDILNKEYEGNLYFYGLYYDGYGAVYWIFDRDKFDNYDALRDFAKDWVDGKR